MGESAKTNQEYTAKGDIIGGFPEASPNCKGCGEPLKVENAWMTDGCPCNSALGVNNMNETRWRLLMELQQQQSRQLEFARSVEGQERTGNPLFDALAHQLIRRIMSAEANCDPPTDVDLRLATIITERDRLKAQTPSISRRSEALLQAAAAIYASGMVTEQHNAGTRMTVTRRPNWTVNVCAEEAENLLAAIEEAERQE